ATADKSALAFHAARFAAAVAALGVVDRAGIDDVILTHLLLAAFGLAADVVGGGRARAAGRGLWGVVGFGHGAGSCSRRPTPCPGQCSATCPPVWRSAWWRRRPGPASGQASWPWSWPGSTRWTAGWR